MRYTYPVLVIEDELGGYCTYLNDFDQVTEGEDIAEAIEMGADALWLMIDDDLQLDTPLPKPTYPEEHKGLLVAINPTNSSPGMAWLLATIGHFGAGSFAGYWKQLMANGARIAEDWSAAYETDFSGSGKGTYPIVVSYASSPSFTVSKDKSSSTTSALLDTAFRQVEYAGVLKGAANPEGGKAFVKWMLSKAVQEDIPGQMYMYPVLPDAALPEALTKFGPLSKSPVKVEPKEITTHREEWLNTWTEAVGK